jgi:hypothetical protein
MNQLSREFLKEIGKHHLVGLGDTGKGKSGFHRHLARAVIANLLEGMTFIDPHGEAARDTAAWCANPQHGIRRPVHVLKPGTDYSFSLSRSYYRDGNFAIVHNLNNATDIRLARPLPTSA